MPSSSLTSLALQRVRRNSMQVWVIDNNLPLNQCKDRRVRRGELPVDREGLSHLATLGEREWGLDSALKSLCEELLSLDDQEVLGFSNPETALAYIERGQNRPDIVFYDWDFSGPDPISGLLQLYQRSFFLVQIFSGSAEAVIKGQIEASPELARLSALRLPIRQKGTPVSPVITFAEEFYRKDFAALIDPMRNASVTAVENTLRELGALPFAEALALLGRNRASDNASQIAEVFTTAILSTLLEVASASQAPEDAKTAAISAIGSAIKSTIEASPEILKSIREMAAAGGTASEAHKLAVRKFLSFQMYHIPADKNIRQGAIFRIAPVESPDLFLVLNAACDLEQGRMKTREVITCLRLHPLTKESGFSHLARGENAFLKMGDSMLEYRKKSGSAPLGAIFFPSVPVKDPATGNTDYKDYVGIGQDVLAIRATKVALADVAAPLTYQSVELDGGKALDLVCAVNFSLLPAVLGTISATITRYGVPNLPATEKNRLTGLNT